jgi:type IV secretion system protein VirD4
MLGMYIGLQYSTQLFAASMNFDPLVVGHPFIKLPYANIFLYNPLLYLLCYVKYALNAAYIPYLQGAAKPFILGGIASIFLVIAFGIMRSLRSMSDKLYGSARWGTDKDMKRAGLLQPDGVVLGMLQGASVNAKIHPRDSSIILKLIKPASLICHGGKLNTLLLGPTGTGKNVSTIIPTIINYRGSMIIFDPKGENYAITAGWRKQFSHVLKFSPVSMDTVKFNPVIEINDELNAFRYAGLIASIIFSPSSAKGGSNDTEEFFNNLAKELYTMGILHVRFSDYSDKSLPGVLKLLSEGCETNESLGEDEDPTDILFDRIANTKHSSDIVHDMIVRMVNRQKKIHPKTRSGVFQTVFSKTNLFEDPLISNATSGNDFLLDDFIYAEHPITLYLTVPYSDIDRISAVFRLLITFMLKRFSDGETKHGSIKLKNHLLFLLDEFPTLGYFPFLAQTMGVLRGYGINFLIACQALSQIIDLYGVNHPFLDHCRVTTIYTPGKFEDAKLFSQTIGSDSSSRERISQSGGVFSPTLSNMNRSDEDIRRDLINPDELMKLPHSEVLILTQGFPPYIGKKLPYFQHPFFKDKVDLPLPSSRKEMMDELIGLPSYKKNKEQQKEKEYREVIVDDDSNDDELFETEFYFLKDSEQSDSKNQIENGFIMSLSEFDDKEDIQNTLSDDGF